MYQCKDCNGWVAELGELTDRENPCTCCVRCKEKDKRIKQLEGDMKKIGDLISKYGYIDGAHHKQWLLDQIIRVVLKDSYSAWAKGDAEYPAWDTGIAP